MGELSVIIAAATGVASLIFLSTRTDNLPRVARRTVRRELAERYDRTSDDQRSTGCSRGARSRRTTGRSSSRSWCD